MLRSFLEKFILLALLASLWTLLAGCANTSTDDTGYTYNLSEQQAMDIAMTGMDKAVYQATSSIVGPMEYEGQNITAFEVTVNGGDHMYLRYVNANSGKLMADMDARHEIPQEDSDTGMDREPVSYYTSCPSGWPLCINPGSIGFYSQRDSSWSSNILNGSSGSTIGNYGCLLSVAAMDLLQDGYSSRNPGQFNTWADTYNNFGNCTSSASDESTPLINLSCVASDLGASYSVIGVSSVWSYIASGEPVIVYGSLTSGGSSCHAQLVWGHDGTRYWTKDPWYDWTNQDQAVRVYSSSACANTWRIFR